MTSKNEVIENIVEQHAEEASFIWLLRDAAIHSHNYTLDELIDLDNRVDAHLDGLRIAGDAGWEICKEALTLEKSGEIFAASVLAFENSAEERIQTVLEAGIVSSDLSIGLVSALCWLPYAQAEKYIKRLVDSDSPDARRVGISASAGHCQDPGQVLIESLYDTHALLRARALKAIGELARKDLLPLIHGYLSSEEEDCRFYAAWSAALLGDRPAVGKLYQMAEEDLPYALRACDLAARIMDPIEARNWLRGLLTLPERQRLALSGFGALGDPAAIPLIMECMAMPELARTAGEAFTMITGVDIAYEDLEGEWPEGFAAGPTENPEDEDVEMDPDENLPWPDSKLIQEWWHKNKSNFRSGVRYLCGKPISEKQCQYILRHGYQRQRAAAAIELALIKPGTPLFNVKAPGFRQQRLLGIK